MKNKLNNRFTAVEKINLNNYITVNFQEINKMEPSVSWSNLAANIKKLIKITVTAPYLATMFKTRAKTVKALLVKRPTLNSTNKGSDKLDTNTSLVTNLTKGNKESKVAPYGLLTTQEVATFFHVSARHIRNLTKSGDLLCIDLGSRSSPSTHCIRYTMDDLIRYTDKLRLESINQNTPKKNGVVVTKLKPNKTRSLPGQSVNLQDGKKTIYPNQDNGPYSDLVTHDSDGVGVFGYRRD